MAHQKKQFSFEAGLQELESLVHKMEDGGLSLEESLKVFEQGVKITRQCQQSLEQAKQKVQILVSENGIDNLKEFDQDNHEFSE